MTNFHRSFSLSRFLNFIKFLTVLNLMIFAMACGGISIAPANGTGATASGNANNTDSGVYLFATDYQSSGQLYVATTTGNIATLSNTGLSLLGSSALIRSFNDLIYILHDGFSVVSSDNLQIVDPSDSYATLGQYSTGNGTNPHDVVVTGSRAFITLYNPTADADNVDTSGLPADVIEMDTSTGTIVNRFSFYNELENDGDRNGNADQMVLVGNTLYVALQDLDSNTFAANSRGLIGIIDITTNTVVDTIPLLGRNPVSLAATSDGAKLVIADMATYDSGLGGFDTLKPYGGIEVVDLEARASLGIIDDEDLGGYVERVEAGGENFYAIVSEFNAADFTYSSKIVALAQDNVSLNSVTTVDDSGTDIREITINNNVLWISRRQINVNTGLSDPILDAYDLSTGAQIGGSLVPVAPGMSMVEL